MLRDEERPATRIMLVEDEPIIALDLRRRLERLGYEITAIADNAEDALSLAARTPPDLVLMDIVIQGPIDGVELAVELGRRGLPVIFLTAHSDAVTLERAKKAHAYGFLVKPFEGRELHTSIELALHRHESDSQRRISEASLKESEERFRQTLDAITDLVLLKRPGSQFLWGNRAMREFYGMSNDALQGILDAPWVAPDQTAQYVRDDARVFSTRQPLVIPDEPATRFDGETRRFRTEKTPIFDASGEVVMLVAVAHDITESTQLASQLRLADRMATVGTLASGIAHEINTPVQFVSDSVHFLRDATRDLFGLLEKLQEVQRLVMGGAPASEQRAAAAAAAEEAENADLSYLHENVPKAFERSLEGLERVTKIVRSMKEFAHPDQTEMATADLNRAIESTLTIARNEYKYVAEVETDLEPLPPVTCHLGELNQVILNLIVNAAHAIASVVGDGGTKGIIRLSTRGDGDSVTIAISDTGTGIPEELRRRVFDPFFTTKEVGKGTGQGLALARAVVVDKHGGELTLESEVGKGTTFFIRLPIDGRPARRP